MPNVFCSTNLLPLIGKTQLSKITSTDSDPRANWNGRLFYINKKKCILFTNKPTLYSVVRLDVSKKQLADPKSFFLSSLFAQLKFDKFYNFREETYWLDNFNDIRYFRTDNDKRVIGSMNDFVYQLKVGLTLGSSLLQVVNDLTAAHYLNTIPMSLIGYKYPREMFRAAIGNS
jgi:hypothetical protein